MRLGILSKVFVRPSIEAVAEAGLECVQLNWESARLPPMLDEIHSGLARRIRDAAAVFAPL